MRLKSSVDPQVQDRTIVVLALPLFSPLCKTSLMDATCREPAVSTYTQIAPVIEPGRRMP